MTGLVGFLSNGPLGRSQTLDVHHESGLSRNENCGPESLIEENLVQLGPQTDVPTYASLLKHCTNAEALSQGKRVHEHMSRHGFTGNRFLSNLLVQMYSKCGTLECARSVFDEIVHPNSYSWNIMIAACSQNGSLDEARAIFAKMPQRDVVSWSAMIAACAQNGHSKEALQLFGQMQVEGLEPNKITFICVVDACTSLAALEEGRVIHATVAGNGWESDVVVGNALVYMYGKCRSIYDARAVFGGMLQRNVVSWSAMMTVYAQNAHGTEALHLFGQMQYEGLEPDKVTFICVVDACASVAALEEGQVIHATVAGNIWESDVVVGTSLINMYGKCRSLDDARAVFAEMPERSVVTWSAMISAFSQNGHGKETLQLFGQMEAEGYEPNRVTFICLVDACASVAALEEGKVTHASVSGKGWESDAAVGNALINMYGKCKRLDDAKAVFADVPQRDVISWTGIIAACAQNGHGKEALQLFGQMQAEGFKPNRVTFSCVVDACTMEEGQIVHATVAGNCLDLDDVVGNALVNMYGKCGSLDDARAVFAEMPQRTVFSWSAMMTVCAQNGHGKDALQLFHQMKAENCEPNEITFLCVLSACSHAGLVDDGRRYFASMIKDHGLTPSVEHYVCMIDLFGRRGLLEEAEDLIISMPCEHVAPAWLSLLSSCRLHNDVERAVHAANFVCKLDPKNASPYLLLPNIHVNAGALGDLEVDEGND